MSKKNKDKKDEMWWKIMKRGQEVRIIGFACCQILTGIGFCEGEYREKGIKTRIDFSNELAKVEDMFLEMEHILDEAKEIYVDFNTLNKSDKAEVMDLFEGYTFYVNECKAKIERYDLADRIKINLREDK